MLNVAGTCSCVVVIQCCRLDSPRLICCPYLRMTWIVSFKGETSVSTDPRHFTWMMTPPPSLRNTPRSVDFLCAVQTNISQQVKVVRWTGVLCDSAGSSEETPPSLHTVTICEHKLPLCSEAWIWLQVPLYILLSSTHVGTI